MSGDLDLCQSIYIIKPEAMHSRISIRELIEAGGLKIRQFRIGVLRDEYLRHLYSDLKPELWKATTMFMQCGETEVGLVEGANAVETLLDIAGHSTNPNECQSGTIRSKYGIRDPDRVGSVVYYRNAIHRAENREEAVRDVSLFSSYLNSENECRQRAK